MAKLNWDAKEREELLAYLDALLGYVRSLHANVGKVAADVAELRDKVFDDPEEIVRYRANLRSAVANAKPIIEEAMPFCDDLWQEIVSAQQYQN